MTGDAADDQDSGEFGLHSPYSLLTSMDMDIGSFVAEGQGDRSPHGHGSDDDDGSPTRRFEHTPERRVVSESTVHVPSFAQQVAEANMHTDTARAMMMSRAEMQEIANDIQIKKRIRRLEKWSQRKDEEGGGPGARAARATRARGRKAGTILRRTAVQASAAIPRSSCRSSRRGGRGVCCRASVSSTMRPRARSLPRCGRSSDGRPGKRGAGPRTRTATCWVAGIGRVWRSASTGRAVSRFCCWASRGSVCVDVPERSGSRPEYGTAACSSSACSRGRCCSSWRSCRSRSTPTRGPRAPSSCCGWCGSCRGASTGCRCPPRRTSGAATRVQQGQDVGHVGRVCADRGRHLHPGGAGHPVENRRHHRAKRRHHGTAVALHRVVGAGDGAQRVVRWRPRVRDGGGGSGTRHKSGVSVSRCSPLLLASTLASPSSRDSASMSIT